MTRSRNHRRAATLPAAAALAGLCLAPTLIPPFAAMPARAAAAGEDPQPAETSALASLAALKLPANALRVPASHALARDAKKQITELAAQSGVSLTGKNELLLWAAGAGYKPGQRTAISGPLAQALARAGLTYKEVHTQKIDTGTMVVFLAVRPGKQPTGVLGMWVASDDSLLLEWADAALQPAKTSETPTAAAAGNAEPGDAAPRQGRTAIKATGADPKAEAKGEQNAELAAKSKIADVRFPGGTLRLLEKDAVTQSTDQLETMMKELGLVLGGSEVLAWAGGDYKPGDNGGIQSSMAGALKSAGYAYTPQPPHKTDDGTLTLFTAGREAKKEALFGFWLAGKDFLLMAWAQARPKADGTIGNAAPAPSGGDAADSAPAALEGAAPLARLTFPKLAPKPMQVAGTVLDRLGKPISGARIRFWRITDQGAFIHQEARTGADGRYSLALSGSPTWKCDNALARREWNGAIYFLPLRPEQGDGTLFDGEDIDISKGRVLNFFLPVSGRIHAENNPNDDVSYYGGSARIEYGIANTSDHPVDRMLNNPGDLPPGTKIELTFAPVGPLLDGTRGEVRRVTATVQETRDYVRRGYLVARDLPLGRYQVGGRLTLPDGAVVPAKMNVKYNWASSPAGAPTADNPLMFAPRNDNWPQQKGGDPAQAGYTAYSAKCPVIATNVELGK